MIRWAPLSIPLERRLQTLAVFSLIATIVVCLLFALLLLFFWPFWPFAFFYFLWMVYDQKTPRTGGRSTKAINLFRSLTKPWFKHYANYFPASLFLDTGLSKSDFSPDQKYLISLHPHGWIGGGIWATFLSEGCSIQEKLGLDFRSVTLKSNFSVPFWREFVSLHGLCDCSAPSITKIFEQNKSVFVVPGGARESLYARPSKKVSLVLENRFGFIRMAIENGASLVPVFSFGEESLYDQVDNSPGTILRKIQDFILAHTGIAFPLVKGRGIFNYSFGLLPHRRPINVVVGKPLKVPHVQNPTPKVIEEVHAQYKDHLRKLFESNKHKYGYGDQELEYLTR